MHEQSGAVSAFRVAGQTALGHALGLLSIGGLVAVFAVVEGPDPVALGIGVSVGLLVVILERVFPHGSTFWGVRDAVEWVDPLRVAQDRWWTVPAAWAAAVAFVLVLAVPIQPLFGDGAPQVAVGALVVGVAHLVTWLAIRRLERARDGLAVELVVDDVGADKPVVLYRERDVGAAFGR